MSGVRAPPLKRIASGRAGRSSGWCPDGLDRLGPVPAEEVAQMLGDGGVGHERQAELLEPELGGALRVLAAGDPREEAVERDRLDLGRGSAPTGCCRR